MLEEIRISGLGVIDDAVLPLSRGLTVVTGETGAGKTMIVQGLALLFGGRSDAGRVRQGADRALVEGRLVLDRAHPAVVRALDAGGELDDRVLLISRSVAADGRSRAHVGGRGVPIGVLGDLAGSVLAVHGQNDQQGLLRSSDQRQALDRFGGPDLLAAVAHFGQRWQVWRAVREERERLADEHEQRAVESSGLRAQLAEVEAADPQPGEDDALRAEILRLDVAGQARSAAALASEVLTGTETGDQPDALGLLTQARRALEDLSGTDPTLTALTARLAETSFVLTDIAAEVASFAVSVEVDPALLATAQERLAELTALIRAHQSENVAGVLAWAQRASSRLLELDSTDDRVVALTAQDTDLAAELGALAADLTARRLLAAQAFAAAVTVELADLAMPDARVFAEVTQRPDSQGLAVDGEVLRAGEYGVDDVEILLTPHPGAGPRALHKGASGGELSRVMLAIEIVFAGSDPLPVMVFDEVDAGVGGRAAVEVGRRLARLASHHQVLVVTHLPQVAAFADRHLVIVKSDDGIVTASDVRLLDDAGRVLELSRMLAGGDSGVARSHAEELMTTTRDLRAQDLSRA